MKFYGGGIASSVVEIENVINAKNLYYLDFIKERPPVDLIIEDVQPFFYYIERFVEILKIYIFF